MDNYNIDFYNKIYYNFANFVVQWIFYRLKNFRSDFIIKFITKSTLESILKAFLLLIISQIVI